MSLVYDTIKFLLVYPEDRGPEPCVQIEILNGQDVVETLRPIPFASVRRTVLNFEDTVNADAVQRFIDHHKDTP